MVTLKILSLEENQAPHQRREPRADNAGISGTAGGHPARHRNQTRVCTLIWAEQHFHCAPYLTGREIFQTGREPP